MGELVNMNPVWLKTKLFKLKIYKIEINISFNQPTY